MNREKLLQKPLPINRVAARVLHGKSEHWTPMGCRSQPYFDTPPLTRRPCREALRNPLFKDYTGVQVGFMRVIGQLAEGAPKAKKGTRWVLRCECACYVIMSGAAIARNADLISACPRCVAKRKLRWPSYEAAFEAWQAKQA